MSIIEGIILGFVQGITEFVPVSSSGHLILVRDWLGISLTGSLAFDAILHLATALAVLIYFRKDIVNILKLIWACVNRKPLEEESKRLLGALIVGTVPAVVLGLLFESTIENTLRGSDVVAWALIAGSILFIFAEWYSKKQSQKDLGLLSGFIIGLFQSLALIPGMSRSGSTISGGLLLGLDREQATRFAFLLSLPVLLGVGGLKTVELITTSDITNVEPSLLVGALVAFGVGYVAIHWMLRFLKHRTLHVFAIYRIILAVIVLIIM